MKVRTAYTIHAFLWTALTTSLLQAVLPPEVSESITEGDQIQDALRQQERLVAPRQGEDNVIDGEAGIFVLRVQEIFYASAAAGIGYESNPVRTSNDPGESYSFNFATSLGVQTRLGDAVDAGASLTFSGVDYTRDYAPSSRTISARATIGDSLLDGPLYFSFSGFGGANGDEHYENGVSFYGVSAALSTFFVSPDQRWILRPSVSVARQLSEREDNNNKSAAFVLSLTHVPTDRLTFVLDGRMTRTWYDNFFEDVTFEERRDWTYSASLGSYFRLNETLTLSATVGYEERHSSLFLSEYRNTDATAMLNARVTF